eukprot:7251947-Prymnesium_polylepis.2
MQRRQDIDLSTKLRKMDASQVSTGLQVLDRDLGKRGVAVGRVVGRVGVKLRASGHQRQAFDVACLDFIREVAVNDSCSFTHLQGALRCDSLRRNED